MSAVEERFWAKVDKRCKNDCWAWTASSCGGYGRFRIGTKMEIAHRVSWEINNGPIADGLLVLHSCDNPSCVNPRHLWLGTHQDNMDDMVSKGRGKYPIRKGGKNGRAKLTEAQVRKIRAEYKPGMSQRRLAEMYGVSQTAICEVVRENSWENI